MGRKGLRLCVRQDQDHHPTSSAFEFPRSTSARSSKRAFLGRRCRFLKTCNNMSRRPSFLSWGPEDRGSIAALVLQEAEILKKYPHLNVAQYHGCLVENARITGLCCTNYNQASRKRSQRVRILLRKKSLPSPMPLKTAFDIFKNI